MFLALVLLAALLAGCAGTGPSQPNASDAPAAPAISGTAPSAALQETGTPPSDSEAEASASPGTADDANARPLTLLTLDGMLPQENVDAANTQLSRKGIPFRLKLRVVPHDQYYDQMMTATDVDLILSERVSALYAFEQGRITDLALLLSDFAALRETAPSEAWAEFSRSGVQVAYPLTNSASDGGWETGVLIRRGEKSPHAADVAYIQFAPDKANFRIGRVADVGMAVCTATREPADALHLLQALYADEDIRNALEQAPNALYGQAGVYSLRALNGPITLLPDCLKMLRDAGADTLREETEKQFQAFLETAR